MKPTHEMTLAEVTLAILKAAVNIPDGLYVHAARLAKRELATYGPDGNLVDATLTSLPDEPDFKSDENALEIFSKLMAHKMAKSAEKDRSGWQQCTQEDLSRMLREHVAKGDPVDVANFCMMLSANGFGIAKPVPPAGDVEVLNAMFEFPMPPTVESVLRIAADGSRIRISADGSIYPVPPAGDAEESVADVVMFEGGKIIDGTLAYMETAVVGDRLYSTAYVNRLTAERDGLKMQLADSDHCYRQAHDTGVMVMRERDILKTELTKARELLQRAEPWLRRLNEKGDNEIPAFVDLVDFLAPQSAPAAKECQQPQAHPARCGAVNHAERFSLAVEPLYRHPQRPVVLPESIEIDFLIRRPAK